MRQLSPSFRRDVAFYKLRFKEVGFTFPTRPMDADQLNAYLANARRRAASDHPKDRYWKPLHGIFMAMDVAAKLER